MVNPFQYITSVTYYPINPLAGELPAHVHFGFWDSGVSASIIPSNSRYKLISNNVTLSSHPQAVSGVTDYLNSAPYTKDTLYYYGFGQIPINSSLLYDSRMARVEVAIDFYSGDGFLRVVNYPSGVELVRVPGQIGIPVPVGQITQKYTEAGISVLGAAASLLTGNFVGAVSGVTSAIKDTMPQVMIQGSQGSGASYMIIPTWNTTFYNIADQDATQHGRPLCKVRTINTLSGYIKTENAEVDLPCTQEERDAIAAYMDGGFYYE